MKKVLVAAILGLAAVASVKAQSFVQLYNYGTQSAGTVIYGSGSSGTVGQGVTTGGYTIGLYWAAGDVTAAVNTFMGGATGTAVGQNNGTLVGSGLTLVTGSGSTVALGADGPGLYDSTGVATLNPSASSASTVTLVLVAYSGSSYEAAGVRGHSLAFTMTAAVPPTTPGVANQTGTFAPASNWAVSSVPEPSTFALAGLGLAGLLIFRRRN